VDLQPTSGVSDPYFALLTRRGKLLIHHYVIIESLASYKKYGRHIKTYDRDVGTLCRDRLRPNFNEICLAAATNGKAGQKLIDEETKSFNSIL